MEPATRLLDTLRTPKEPIAGAAGAASKPVVARRALIDPASITLETLSLLACGRALRDCAPLVDDRRRALIEPVVGPGAGAGAGALPWAASPTIDSDRAILEPRRGSTGAFGTVTSTRAATMAAGRRLTF